MHVWGIAAEKEVTVLEGHTGEVRALISHPTRRALATGSFDKTVRIWTSPDPAPGGTGGAGRDVTDGRGVGEGEGEGDGDIISTADMVARWRASGQLPASETAGNVDNVGNVGGAGGAGGAGGVGGDEDEAKSATRGTGQDGATQGAGGGPLSFLQDLNTVNYNLAHVDEADIHVVEMFDEPMEEVILGRVAHAPAKGTTQGTTKGTTKGPVEGLSGSVYLGPFSATKDLAALQVRGGGVVV